MHNPTWCPGCGNFGILAALKQAFVKLDLNSEKAVAVFDIGCNSNMFNWLPITSFEGLHGRPLPVAEGIKLVRPDLSVLVISGDGGCYGEGGNHFLHAAKHNLDITVLVHDNEVYALTTGQASPTSVKGLKTKSTPAGSPEEKLNPLAVALAAGAGFVARGFSGDIPQLTDLMVKAINHKGFSIVDILQPCVTFNPFNSNDWYKQRVYDLEKSGYKPDNKLKALERSMEFPQNGIDSKIPIGIFYEEEKEPLEIKQSFSANKKLSSQEIKESDFDLLIKEFV